MHSTHACIYVPDPASIICISSTLLWASPGVVEVSTVSSNKRPPSSVERADK